MYVARKSLDGRPPAVRYGTVDPELVKMRYREKHRKTGTLAGFSVVEHAGWDKSTITLRFTKEDSRAASGAGAMIGQSLTFRLLDRHKHLRRLDPADAEILAEHDRKIETIVAQLEAARQLRKAAVEQAWKRGHKIDISELEEKADAATTRPT